MSSQLFKRIVDEVAAESPYTEVWPTFMGEAMLLGDRLFDLIEYAKTVGCKKAPTAQPKSPALTVLRKVLVAVMGLR